MAYIQGEPIAHCIYIENVDLQAAYVYDDLIVALLDRNGRQVKEYRLSRGEITLENDIATLLITGEQTARMKGRYYLEYAILVNGSKVGAAARNEIAIEESSIR